MTSREGAMTINRTGHAEIDQQHELLDHTVKQLESFCSEADQNPNVTCDGCDSVRQKHCRSALASISKELGAFLGGHFSYEEKMMELLPATPSCQLHVKAHTMSHEGVLRQLKKLTLRAETESPREIGFLIWRIVGDWLGDHSTMFDIRLVRLGKSDQPKMDFDTELVTMLDQHVFPDRPTKSKASSRASVALRAKKLEVRGRFESLSTTQRKVFWLAVSGKKNQEIASTLEISINTVKTHRAAIFQKMEVI
jgi:DNA-binding CsgD family transcriptional regulator/hemerythrin